MKKHLIYTNNGSNKFWDIEITGKFYFITFGTIGSAGQSFNKEFPSDEICLKEANKLIKEKLNKGYQEFQKT